jgi:hypothetical protein
MGCAEPVTGRVSRLTLTATGGIDLEVRVAPRKSAAAQLYGASARP